jgi:hypothetical protein
MSDDQNLRSATAARTQLKRLGIAVDNLTDEQAVALWAEFLRRQIPAPSIPAGSPPVNARAWAAAALTAGGFVAPEDRRQRAHLDDGGPEVDLGVIGVLVMRHLSNSRPKGWTDEALAARFGDDPENFRRAQQVIDMAADDVGRPAKSGARWWLTA